MKLLKIASMTLLASVVIAACCPCRKNKSAAKNNLPFTETVWSLIKVNSTEVKPDGNFNIVFHDDKSVNGMGSCNRFFGSYTSETAGKIKIGPLGATRMMCPGVDLENEYMQTLDKIDTYTVDGNTLMLLNNGELLLLFEGEAPKAK